MERLRPTLFLIVVAAGALLAACGGGTSPAGFFSPGTPLADLQPQATKIVVKPRSLTFDTYGATFAKKVEVSEKGYTGKIAERSTCKGIAKRSPLSGKGPKFAVKVTPLKDGSCEITFVDAKKHKGKLSILVDDTKPTPTPSPTGNPTSTPTSGPPTPTPTPNLPASIFVTYSASTAHPNVVAYDAQGNKKSSGSWGGSGIGPQSIAWAPGDLNWFYVTNGSSALKVYSGSGGQLSFCTSVTDAGAIAYPSGATIPAGGLLYVALPGTHTIAAFNEDCSVLSPSFPTNIDTTLGGLTYDSNASRIYVSNTSSGNVEYYGKTTGTLGGSISEPGGCTCAPGAIAFDSANDRIYVWWSGTGGGMTAYDESGNPVTLTGGSGTPFSGLTAPQAIAYDSDNHDLYVTDGTSVKVFDATGSTVTTTGTFSPGFAVTSANGITFK